ncbi:lysylphosphatidylglycerol synthase domain-containing protein [Hyunsoonleella aestuarii]|uniref:lysylphosphatidylglycerol synthase domain-containing protein n=1 Tax=Hyunsoonleella aestuarii TaxID=912802 RepID=UPI0011115341|nr:lysylphosphatidylglycerol synthase domain-containing protein [Hyunsoonleella aestuarii]
MQIAIHYKSKQFFFVLIKLSIVVCAFYFIYHKLKNNSQLDFFSFILFLTKKELFLFKNLAFLLFLSTFNWFFEILKWQILVSILKKISYKEALEQSLASLTASLFTPNRIGEYGAKAMYYIGDLRKDILLLNLVGNMMQMGVTLIFGIMGLLLFVSNNELHLRRYNFNLLAIIIIITGALLYFFTKNSTFSIRGYSLQKIKNHFQKLPQRNLRIAFAFSFIRYIIFSFQFFVLMRMFQVDIAYYDCMIAISTMYLLASIVPSIFILDVLVKGSVAVYIFSLLEINELTILCIVTLMWLFNFVFPSIVGSYYVLKFNLPKDHSST